MGVFLTLIVFILLLSLLYYMQKTHVKYVYRVFTGLGLGIVFGAAIQLIFGADSGATATIVEWLDVVGRGYVSILQMLVIPIIMVSLIHAFTQIEEGTNISKIGFNVIATLIITVSIASALGIAMVLLFNLDGATFTRGAQETARIASLQESQAQIVDLTLPQQLLSFLPTNIFQDMTGARPTSTIAIVIVSLFVGIAYRGVERKQPEEAAIFKKIVDAFHAIVMRVVTLVLRLSPYGILALIAVMMASSSMASLINMGTFVIACYAAIIIMYILHLVIVSIFKVSPMQYLRKTWNVMSFAFTSRSSAGALPLNVASQQTMGVDATTANFAGTFGLSIGQNGCAGIYPTMLAAIVAPTMGYSFADPETWLLLIATAAITSFGVAGVGGGATFASLIMFGLLGFPIEMIGLMVSIEPIVDMGRTALNVNDSIVAGVVSARLTGTLDDEVLNDNTIEVSPEADF